jgi:hypothetical protein
MIVYVENPDGTLRGVSHVEREVIEPLFVAFTSPPTSVALTFENGTTVTYRKREA